MPLCFSLNTIDTDVTDTVERCISSSICILPEESPTEVNNEQLYIVFPINHHSLLNANPVTSCVFHKTVLSPFKLT